MIRIRVQRATAHILRLHARDGATWRDTFEPDPNDPEWGTIQVEVDVAERLAAIDDDPDVAIQRLMNPVH